MSKRYYWKQDKDSTLCVCSGLKDAKDTLRRRGGKAWVEHWSHGGLQHIENIKLPAIEQPAAAPAPAPAQNPEYFNQ